MFFEEYDLYVSGDRGYQECRIPALLTTLKGTILAFNEARKFTGRDSDQIDLFLRRSYDECRTWPVSKVIYEGPSSYSDICIAPDGTICCLYEKGQEKGVSRYSGDISFARFDLEWLTDGADTLNPVAGSKEVTDNDSTKREI